MQKKRPDYKGLVHAILQLLQSNDYPCPGEHGDAKQSGERGYEARREEWEEQWLADHGYPADPEERYCVTCHQRVWDYVAHYDRIPDMPSDPTYKGAGQCKGQIQVVLDIEYGEYGSILSAWPIAHGPCAEKLGLDEADDPSDLDYGVFQRFSERCSLRKEVERLARRYHVAI